MQETSNIKNKSNQLGIVLGLTLLLILLLSAMQPATRARAFQRDTTQNGFIRPFPNERPPRDDHVAAQAAGIKLGSSRAEIEALDAWYKTFYSRNQKSGPNPRAYEKRLAELEVAENAGLSLEAVNLGEIGVAQMLMIPFEFKGMDELATCDAEGNPVGTSTVTGPLHGGIPNPALQGDNNTIWTENFSIDWYEDLIFGDGVGVVRSDLNGGSGVDLSGISARNWYREQSEGRYDLQGEIYPEWVQLDHSVAWYGWDGDELNPEGSGYPCDGTPSGYGFEFVIDIVDKINASKPDFDWAEWDTDGDGFVDHLMVIHAGVDNSAGGGQYGNYQIWTHSWDVYTEQEDGSLTLGYLADDGGTPNNPGDDIYVANYTVIPEDADIGGVVHEFGHDIGLPDYYDQTGETDNSAAHWIEMAGGSWNGALGGTHPAPFNPWARYFLGWETPARINFDSPAQSFTIGQSDPTPQGAEDSLWIGLPDQVVEIENFAGEGAGLHAILGNHARHSLSRTFNLTAATTPVFTFDTYFRIEEDWDYAYVMVSTDGGVNWDVLLNEEGVYATSNPNSSLAWQGAGGLTGEYEGTLTYNLAAYAGAPALLLSIDYITDGAVQDSGIWLDNLSLDDGETNLYANDLEDSSDWTNTDEQDGPGWEAVPYTDTFSHYYMLEWRNNQGSIASAGHKEIYYTLTHDQEGWLVDKFAANVPGMLVWYRNNRYENNQAASSGREFDLPAFGPKGELLLVDAHHDPITWSGGWWDPEAGEPTPAFSNRRAAMDGAFNLSGRTPAWNIHDYADSANKVLNFGSRGPISTFRDSLRSVPGWVFPGDGYTYRADKSASVVIPGDEYTTRIRALAADGVNIGPDYEALWGLRVGGRELGSGHPGDNLSHYGIVVDLVDQTSDGSYGVINFKNSRFETTATADYGALGSGGTQFAYIGQRATADVQVNNLGGALFNGLIIVELPDNVSYVPGSMAAGLVGISQADAGSLYQAAEYIESVGFDNLLAMPEPGEVSYIAYHVQAIGTATKTFITFDYVGWSIGTATADVLIRHANGGTFGSIQPLPSLTVQPAVVFFPALPIP
jgi:immune inhibitor A